MHEQPSSPRLTTREREHYVRVVSDPNPHAGTYSYLSSPEPGRLTHYAQDTRRQAAEDRSTNRLAAQGRRAYKPEWQAANIFQRQQDRSVPPDVPGVLLKRALGSLWRYRRVEATARYRIAKRHQMDRWQRGWPGIRYGLVNANGKATS